MSLNIKSFTKSLTDFLDKNEKKAIAANEEAHKRAGIDCEKALRRELSKDGGRPGSKNIRYSSPGELPYKHSGILQTSMGYVTRKSGKTVETLIGSVRSAVNYALFLETKPPSKGGRPYLSKICDPVIDKIDFLKDYDK
jgi:hypothetical protein